MQLAVAPNSYNSNNPVGFHEIAKYSTIYLTQNKLKFLNTSKIDITSVMFVLSMCINCVCYVYMYVNGHCPCTSVW